ncbi:hypothetical protein, partial [Delftia tsuruhatensis]|uniref:hypothetical protein n=1 Tax=Delftia tsuruhatensis TaxID=180282 RepID=UPI00214FC49F
SSPVLRQDCNPATTTPQALTYGEFARAVASLGLFLSALVVQSLYHFDRPPVQGLVRKNTDRSWCWPPHQRGLVASEYFGSWGIPTSISFGRDGATRKDVRTALHVFLTSRPPAHA